MPGNKQRRVIISLLYISIISSFVLYVLFNSDRAPDSIAGYIYAFLGTGFLLLTTFQYTRTRHIRQRQIGTLHAALKWHISFGILTLLFLFLHSFGNFNPRSGTYALYALLALVISGAIGRWLDRTIPRKIALAVSKTLTPQGEDRLELFQQNNTKVSTRIQQEIARGEQEQHTASVPPHNQAGQHLPGAWDIAYHTLENNLRTLIQTPSQQLQSTAQLRPLQLDVPPLAEQHIEEKRVHKALNREQYYRTMLRSWRIIHVLLAWLTLGLTLWHLYYAATLVLPTLHVR